MTKRMLPIAVGVLIVSMLLTGCNNTNKTDKPQSNDKSSESQDTENNSKQASSDSTEKGNTEPEDESSASDDNDTNSGDALDDTEAVYNKLSYYVDCINNTSPRILDSYERYTSWMDDPDKGPTGNETNVYGLYSLVQDPQGCIDGLKEAKTLSPRFEELEQAGEAYAASVDKLAPLIKEANDYYEQGDYKDDALAKGKEMHPELIAAFKAFDDADWNLRGAYDTIEDQVDERRLAELEKEDGRKLPFLSENAVYNAKKVFNAGNVGQLEDINLDEFNKLIENYDKAVTELEDYYDAHKSEAPIAFDSMFIRYNSEFLTAAKELMRRVRDKVPYDSMEESWLGTSSGWMVEGSPDQLLYNYNNLIDASNGLSF